MFGCRLPFVFNFLSSVQVSAGNAFGIDKVCVISIVNYRTPGGTGQRSDIHNPFGSLDDIRVVFNYKNAVSLFLESLEYGKQFFGIPGMKSDGGFVQNIKEINKIAVELPGHFDSLGFTSGQSGNRTVQRKVANSDFY